MADGHGASVNHYPNGDLNINLLPTMEGEEFLRLGYPAAHVECQRRVQAHWYDWQVRSEDSAAEVQAECENGRPAK